MHFLINILYCLIVTPHSISLPLQIWHHPTGLPWKQQFQALQEKEISEYEQALQLVFHAELMATGESARQSGLDIRKGRIPVHHNNPCLATNIAEALLMRLRDDMPSKTAHQANLTPGTCGRGSSQLSVWRERGEETVESL
ncbi:hypothetical protein Leryth_006104 [Lithospermum erythrorhizon]|nr:hypothetical protein Leryth_006104 [Lithospermum erythrorhizon]